MKIKNYSLKEVASPTPQLMPAKPIIIGKQKYSGVWFDHITKKEVGIKIGSNIRTETGRKFKCVEIFKKELSTPPVDITKYNNKKVYINYPDSFVGPTGKVKVEIWMLVE